MNKTKIVIYISLYFFIFLKISLAATPEDLTAKIEKLKTQIKELQNIQNFNNKNWCYDFNRNLKFNEKITSSTDKDIIALKIALNKEGLYSSLDFNRNVFDDKLLSSVIKFQYKYKDDILNPVGLSSGSGFIGFLTRKKLNYLYGCKKTSSSYSSVISSGGSSSSFVNSSRSSPSSSNIGSVSSNYSWSSLMSSSSFSVAVETKSSSSDSQQYGIAEVRPYFSSGESVSDIVGVKYRFKIVDNDGQNMKILFGNSRLKGDGSDTYLIERNIYNSKVSYSDNFCDGGWEKLNDMTVGQSTLRIAVPDYIKKGKTGLKTANSSFFPKITYNIDGIEGLAKTDAISQSNLNNQEGVIETLRGDIIKDKNNWKCNSKSLDSDSYRQWNVNTTINNLLYGVSIALPENNAKYLTSYELINFRTEFFHNKGLFKIYLWDFEFKKEGSSNWESLNKWRITDYDGNGSNYGVRKNTYNGNNVIEISNDNSSGFLSKNDVFELKQSHSSSSFISVGGTNYSGNNLSSASSNTFSVVNSSASSSSSVSNISVSISTLPPSPNIINKYNGSTISTKPSWSWQSGSGGGTTEKYYVFPSWLSSGFYTTENTYSPSDSFSDGHYWVNIAAVNQSGWSDYAGDGVLISNTAKPATPVFINKYGGSTVSTKKPSWSWQSGSGGGAVSEYWVFPSWLSNGFFTTATSYTSETDLSSGTYWINISAKNSIGWSEMVGDTVVISTQAVSDLNKSLDQISASLASIVIKINNLKK